MAGKRNAFLIVPSKGERVDRVERISPAPSHIILRKPVKKHNSNFTVIKKDFVTKSPKLEDDHNELVIVDKDSLEVGEDKASSHNSEKIVK